MADFDQRGDMATNGGNHDRVMFENELDDSKGVPDIEFSGATLSLDDGGGTRRSLPEPGSTSLQRAQSAPGDRPATYRHSSGSIDSHGANTLRVTEFEATKFFGNRKDALEVARMVLVPKYVRPDLDGEVVSMHTLAEIDHWDHERERVVFVCEKSVVVANYDFITQKALVVTRVLYKVITTVQHGPLEYPRGSFMKRRDTLGTQLMWLVGSGDTTFSMRWNPFSKQIPYLTLTSHRLAEKIDGEVEHFKVENFQQSLEKTVQEYCRGTEGGWKINFTTGTIQLTSMIGVTARVFNESYLGYAKERGGVNF